MTAGVWFAVAAGGFLGTEARYLLGLLFPELAGAFPWTTLAVNVAGSLVLGFLTSRWAARPATPRWFEAGLGPGLVGSFTTFSAVTLALATAFPGLLSAGYLGLSLLLGLGAAALGMALGRGGRPA